MQSSYITRNKIEEDANYIDISAYRLLTGSFGFIGVRDSPFCAQASSVLQQMLLILKVKNIIDQINHVKMLHYLGTEFKYRRRKKKGEI